MGTLIAGARFGAYDVLAMIGVGGMGEVYRARDTKLKRGVALKVLPEAFSRDSDRLVLKQLRARQLLTPAPTPASTWRYRAFSSAASLSSRSEVGLA
jgi:serine/threonine protein kinase